MDDISFEAAIDMRARDMLDACIRCGKCVEACPTRQPAGIAEADPVTVITGIIRSGEAPEASRQWAAVRP